MFFVFPLLLSRKIFIEIFLHALVYNQVFTLVPALVNTSNYISYICPFYTCLNFLVLTYTCLYMHAYIYICICYTYFPVYFCLTILVYIIANIYLSKLSCQYVFVDILAYIYLPVHTCLYILFYTFIYTLWTKYFFLLLLYIHFLVCGILPVLSICLYYLLVLVSMTQLCYNQDLIQFNHVGTYLFWEQVNWHPKCWRQQTLLINRMSSSDSNKWKD